MKRYVLISLMILFTFSIARAQTYISDKQEVYGVWTKSNSPFIVQGEAIVPKGTSLTIEPGVTVKFKTDKQYDASEPNFDKGFLRVNGKINANGTNKEWITFTRLGSVGTWGTVFLEDMDSYTILSYCKFEHAYKVNNAEISDNSRGGLSILNTNCEINNCIFYKNNFWVVYTNSSDVQINNCTFYNPGNEVVFNLSSNVKIKNSILLGNSTANDIVSGETIVQYCLIEDKLYENTISENNLFKKKPQFKNIKNGDFRLKSNSPCINAGENGVDIGAIPYKSEQIASNNNNFNKTEISQADKILPKISISSPYNNYKTQNQSITINGKASDENGIFQVLVNNTVATLQSNGEFSAKVNLNNSGNNTIRIQATDNKLNTKSDTINVIREEKQVVYEKRLALVIGNSKYQQNVGDLRNPINDANDMKTKLKSMHFEVMEYENLTYPQMRNAISEYGKKLKNYDVGLVYYSGHGLASGGDNYLIPSDATLNYEETVKTECISQNYILSQMEGAGTDVNIIILDACRNNPFQKIWGRGITDTEWASVTAPQGTFIAYATSPKKTAHDGWGDNGAYTAELLKYIDEPGLTIEQVFKKVRSAVDYKFRNMRFKQMPWESTSLKGEFYFKKE